jgi:hypothetical protein
MVTSFIQYSVRMALLALPYLLEKLLKLFILALTGTGVHVDVLAGESHQSIQFIVHLLLRDSGFLQAQWLAGFLRQVS